MFTVCSYIVNRMYLTCSWCRSIIEIDTEQQSHPLSAIVHIVSREAFTSKEKKNMMTKIEKKRIELEVLETALINLENTKKWNLDYIQELKEKEELLEYEEKRLEEYCFKDTYINSVVAILEKML